MEKEKDQENHPDFLPNFPPQSFMKQSQIINWVCLEQTTDKERENKFDSLLWKSLLRRRESDDDRSSKCCFGVRVMLQKN